MEAHFHRGLAIFLMASLIQGSSGWGAATRPTVIVPLLPGDANDRARRAIERELRDSARVNLVEPDSVDQYLSRYSAKNSASSEVDQGGKFLETGQRYYRDLKLTEAIQWLIKAKLAFRKNLSSTSSFEGLRAAQFHLAMAYSASNDLSKARQELREVVILDPERQTRNISKKHYSPKIVSLYEEVRREILKGDKGDLEILSDPSGAILFFDGESMGATPVTLPDLPVGQHHLRLENPGTMTHIGEVVVTKGKDSHRVTLAPPLDERIHSYFDLVRTSKEIEANRAAFLDDMGIALKADIFVFLAPGQAAVRAQWYDQRSQEVSPIQEGSTPHELVMALLPYIDSAGYVSPSTAPKTPPGFFFAPPSSVGAYPGDVSTLSEQAQQPLTRKNRPGEEKQWYEKYWIWGAIGGSILLIGGGVLLFTDVGKSNDNSDLRVTIP